MKKQILRQIPYLTLFIAAVIITLSLLPSSDFPKKSWLSFPGVDKVVHVLMYLTLTITFSGETGYRKIMPAFNLFYIGLSSLLLSAGLELIQRYFTESRLGDWFDLGANFGGIMLGAGLSLLFRQFRFGPFRGFRETPRPGLQ